MRLQIAFLSAACMAWCMAAQGGDEKKFTMSGFADTRLIKTIFPDNSPIGLEFDSRWKMVLDHVNLYQNFKPNDHVRMLTELSFQQRPVTQIDARTGLRLRMDMPAFMGGGSTDTVLIDPRPEAGHSTLKDYAYFDWGSFSVQRAMFSVLVNRSINISTGKFITPAGIWNVDHGSPAIMTIKQPSQYSTISIYPPAQLGLMEEGRAFIANADLSYCLYLSSGRQGLSFKDARDMGAGGQAILNLPVLDECRIGISGYTGTVREQTTTAVIHFTEADITALGQQAAQSVIAENPAALANQELFTGLMYAKFQELTQNDMLRHLSYEEHNAYKYRENIFGIDTRLKKRIFGLQGELNYLMADNLLVNNAQSGILAYYALGSVDVFRGEKFGLTPYVMWEQVRIMELSNNPMVTTIVSSVEALGTSAFYNSSNSIEGYRNLLAGVNMRFFTNYGLKLEYTHLMIDESIATVDKDDMKWAQINVQFYIAF